MGQSKEIFPSLIGNDRLRHTLSGNLTHAYIIEGAKGSGRLTAVRCCAAASLCENRNDANESLPCMECSVCSRIFRGIHPDVIEVSPGDKKSIGVDTARTIRSQVFISPSESEKKFFVIRDADLMTPEAQNALLISLEEPPEFSVFFLLVTDKSLLLETIRSRCVTLNTEKLDPDTIKDALMEKPEGATLHSKDPDAFARIIDDSDGSLGEAMRMLGEGSKDEDSAVENAAELIRVILTGSPSDKVRLVCALPKSKADLDRIFTAAVCAARDIISVKLKTDASMLFYRDRSDAARFTTVSTAKLMVLHSALEDARLALTGNASPALTAERVIMIKL